MLNHPRLAMDLNNVACQWLGGAGVKGNGLERTMTDPTTAQSYGSVPDASSVQVDHAVELARWALPDWSATFPGARARVLFRLADLIEARADDLASVEAVNVGKPVAQARRDAGRAADYFRFYAGCCDKLNGETIPLGPDQTALTVPEPIGVSAHIIPWNYPLSTLARGVAPALAVGTTVVAKPPELTPFTAVMVAQLALEAGVPDGAFNVVTGGGEIGAALAGHPDVDQVTFTGSTATGRKVMQAASAPVADVSLELGGKSPVIVLGDANMEDAAEGVLRGIFFNAGQVCAAGSRLICTRDIHDALIERVAEKAKAMQMGHPLDNPDLGPLASRAQLDRVQGYVNGATKAGSEPVLGGIPTAPSDYPDGYFYPPTIFADVSPDAEIAREEVFGPVLTTFLCDDADHALALANGCEFGLVAGVYSRDSTTALRLARRLHAGQVFVNGFLNAGDTVPFGGVKHSGIGREKGLAGLDTYVARKSIILNHPG
ncbi:aldehyde dehydrogenase family protein [Ruegeria lacuscaerulensis]|uniref:aldehyde dehydrogenase family protein n=1 Tax=Ruegeria lacuscaerulensis TaxID=55218 RepID=UPI00147A84F7|nr:aldehyde dehydrogenase family protein [Ruegeria lacuscaerulensis]